MELALGKIGLGSDCQTENGTSHSNLQKRSNHKFAQI
jgi:hypothetical protein